MKSFDFYFAYCLGKAIKDKMKNLSKSFKLCAAEGQDPAAKIIRKLQGLQQKKYIQLAQLYPTLSNISYQQKPSNVLSSPE